MAKETQIAWTDSTFNPWWGCQKVGPGCDHCYAETLDHRTGGAHWGPGAERRRTSVKNWNEPRRWEREAPAFLAANGRRRRVFCASMADVFDNAVPDSWRADLFKLIDETPNLDWLILTKRIGNVAAMASSPAMAHTLATRVWLGATIVNQQEADRDIHKLLRASARKRFLSLEPLLGPVDLENVVDGATGARFNCLSASPAGMPSIDWAIAGGESGANARPMHPEWPQSIADACSRSGTAKLFKQWGEWAPNSAAAPAGCPSMAVDSGTGAPVAIMRRIGVADTGRLLGGALIDEFPA